MNNTKKKNLTTNAIVLLSVDSHWKQLLKNCIVFHTAIVSLFTLSASLDKIWVKKKNGKQRGQLDFHSLAVPLNQLPWLFNCIMRTAH